MTGRITRLAAPTRVVFTDRNAAAPRASRAGPTDGDQAAIALFGKARNPLLTEARICQASRTRVGLGLFGRKTGNTNYGIVIEKKNHDNIISVTHNDGHGKTDMVDLNNKCDSNIWYDNTDTKNQGCIQ